MSTNDIALQHHQAATAEPLLDALVDAYGAPPGEDPLVKASAFRSRASRALEAPNYGLVTAQADDHLVG